MVYTYADNDLPLTITETGLGGLPIAVTTFTYDLRGRLRTEARVGEDPYDLEYTYDKGGNRKTKRWTDAEQDIKTTYTYDYENPGDYLSNNNRLMEYKTEDMNLPVHDRHIATTFYLYNDCGNVERVITRDEPDGSSLLLGGGTAPMASGDPCEGLIHFSATRFFYAQNGSAVTFMHDEDWCLNGDTIQDYDITWGREFRYDGGRQKYLVRVLDPGELLLGNVVATSETWSDYDGDDIYGDYTVTPGSPPTVENTMSYEPGIGRVPWTADPPEPDPSLAEYYHADHLGTLRNVTTVEGIPVGMRVFTAFGEPIAGPMEPDRFGYAGKWGYQRDSSFEFLHVGARWYDPDTGRFVQRDPIGILGGLGVYEYVQSAPSTRVDPSGFIPDMGTMSGTGADGTVYRGGSLYGGPKRVPGTGPQGLGTGTVNNNVYRYEDMRRHRDAYYYTAAACGVGLGVMGLVHWAAAGVAIVVDSIAGFWAASPVD